MNQEEGYNYPEYKATCIPYWDTRCGEVFYNASEFVPAFEKMYNQLDAYSPREYVLQTLTMDKCSEYFAKIFTSSIH
jgi:hypothetical protein